MKTTLLFLLFTLSFSVPAQAEDVDIISLHRNGSLTWTNPLTNGLFSVQWTDDLASGVWRETWNPLTDLMVSGPETTVSVPMFYRVKAIPNPLIPLPMGVEVVYAASNPSGATWERRVRPVARAELSTGMDYTVTEIRDPQSLFLIPFRSTTTEFHEISFGIATNEVLMFQDAPVGTVWTNDFADGSRDQITIQARETITVPAGTFDCLKFVSRELNNDLKLSSMDWVAPGVALVRSVNYENGELEATYELAGNGGNPPGIDPQNYLPLAVGNQWVYEPGYGDGPRTDTVIGFEQIGSVQTFKLERQETAPDNYQEIRWLAWDGSSLRLHQIWGNEGPIQENPLLVDPSWTVIRSAVSAADQWEEHAAVGSYEFSWLISVQATRSVISVPAGVFENCLVLRTQFTLRQDGQVVDQSRSEQSYAPGVGMVLNNSYENGWSDAPYSQKLVRYTLQVD